ncbi:hypothetical protein LINGRAHAP2_LOCUS36194 [Linum grandiflorum]
MVTTKDEELSLFFELRRHDKEMEKSSPVTIDASPGTKGGIAPLIQAVPQQMAPLYKNAAEKFLDSENEKSDYDWLITPPGTPLFPSVEMEGESAMMNQLRTNARPTVLKSRLTNIQQEAPRTNGASKTKIIALPSGLNSSSAGRRSSFSGGPKSASRPSTPTSRPTLASAKLARSSTPTGRPTLSSTKPAAASARASTPTGRQSLPSSKSTSRASTPTGRQSLPSSKSTSRSSTPTGRQSLPSSKSTSRSSTPTRRLSTPSSSLQGGSRGISPTVKSRTLLHDAPQTSLPKRTASATKARPGGPDARPRQQSCSPAKTRTSNPGGKLPVSIKSIRTADCDDVNPVLMGTQSVERVVNMRKLAPPKQGDHRSSYQSNSASKSSSHDSTGFGRSLSKKSLDMAMRHMDIGRSITRNLRALSARSDGSTKGIAISASESPHATSSNASSEPSVNNNFVLEAEENDIITS